MAITPSPLSYAVRLPVLGKYLGQLAFMLALLTLVPLFAALGFQEYQYAVRYLAVIVVLSLLWFASRSVDEPLRIQSNEAFMIVALTFVLSPILMTFPLMSSGLSFGNALFEAISAVTTTGLSVASELPDKSQTFLFSRAWMQWYGGLGIVVLSVALLMEYHVSSRSLAEPLGGETLATTTRTHARRMLIIYSVLTLLGIGLVWTITGDGFVAICHVLAGISTGGFSTLDNSLADLDAWSSRYTIMFMCLCGAIPLPMYYVFRSKNWSSTFKDPELLMLLLAVALVSILLTLFLHSDSGMSMIDAVKHGLLLGISAQTTAGFSSLDVIELSDSAKLTMIFSMLIGGNVGSTAGGLKLLRLLILIRLIQVLLQRTTLPAQAVHEPKLGGKPLEDSDIQRVLVLMLLFIGVIIASWFVFLLYGYAPLDALFEVVSATATVGLSTGITSAELPAVLKFVLSVDMLLGRLEIIALLVVLYLPNWIGKRKESE